MSRDGNNFKRFAIGGAVAAAAGYVAGVLTAPKSGKETRSDIKQAANENLAQAEKELKRLNTELGLVIDEARVNGDRLSAKARNDLSELVDNAKDTKEKVREVIGAFHEGEAEDADLKKAVKQANAAIKNLRTFLKK
ncbi:MAG: YtxH domain-containing protein [Candidatus Saccharimonadales bacterium]